MVFVIRANNTTYTVSEHAAQRMLQRFISEIMVIAALENGSITEQAHGSFLYEHQLYDETLEDFVTVCVVVDEDNQVIISVIDDTDEE